MKKLLSVVAILGLFMVAACGGGGGSDVKSVMGDLLDTVDKFAADGGGASDGDAFAAAIENFSDKMKEIIPKMKALKDKYPQLMQGKDIPPELAEFKDRIEGMQDKMKAGMGKMMNFASNPKVMEAIKKMQEAMKDMM